MLRKLFVFLIKENKKKGDKFYGNNRFRKEYTRYRIDD